MEYPYPPIAQSKLLLAQTEILMKINELNNIKLLKDELALIDIKRLDDILIKLKNIIKEKKLELLEEENNHLKNELCRNIMLSNYEYFLCKNGINIKRGIDDEYQKTTPIVKKEKTYCYIDSKGTKRYWMGKGRPPSVILKAIALGGNIKDFLV